MKQRLFLVALLVVSTCGFSQRYWKVYKPVSSGILGSSVNGYRQYSLALNPLKTSLPIQTTTGSSTDFEQFKRRSALDIIGFVSNTIKVQTIDAKGQIYIDQISDPTKMVPGVRYVYAGLRSDSVLVTLEKTANTEVKLNELIQTATLIGLKLDSTIVDVNWADSIKFNRDKRISFSVRNPAVYYSVQFATVKPGGVSDAWIQTFNPGTPNRQTATTLRFLSGQDQTRELTPVGGNNTMNFWLAIDKDENNTTNLYLKSSDGDNILLQKNRLGNSEWYYSRYPVKTYPTGGNKFKIVMLDLEAKPSGDGIKIVQSRVRYPDARLDIER